jgi:hypothetical protein
MEPLRTAELYRNGELALRWEVVGSNIASPGIGHGESLRQPASLALVEQTTSGEQDK